jgi:hypothetical protein
MWKVIAVSFASRIFVSTTGSDTTGTVDRIDLPFRTIPKAISVMAPGDTIYVRGGVYFYTGSSTAITLPPKPGISAAVRCCLMSYPGERALLDFSAMTGTSADGLKINGSYWTVKGLDFKGAPHNGLKISGGNYNIIEFCSTFENRNTGVQLAAGASSNRIINCDSYYNADVTYGNADGFSPKLDVGTGNYFYGCRSWQNSDDGWDGYLRPSDDVTDTLENCWSFMNGYLKNGTVQSGNGNGFKMGGGDQDSTKTVNNVDSLRHDMILKKCLSFDNKAKGFDQNNNRGSMTLYNCSGYRNGSYNFSIPGFIRVGDTVSIKNCISLASPGIALSGIPNPILAANSWMSPFLTADSSDFISLDTTGVRGPRKPDGSLPDVQFMHLAKGSQFIDAGSDVGLPYLGMKPDLGCFETNFPTGVTKEDKTGIADFQLYQNYPNPFNPSTEIRYTVASAGFVKLCVYTVLGREAATLVDERKQPGNYTVRWNASKISSGIYYARLSGFTGNWQPFTKTLKMLLIK